MKLSTQIRYGVRSLCDIAYYSAGSPVQVNDIAGRQDISPRYIEQIFQRLKKAGIIRSVRGPSGGYFLARKPEKISVGDVIRAVDGKDIDLVFCSDEKGKTKKRCKKVDTCVLSPVWNEASKRLMDYFNSVSINQVCGEAREKGTGL